MTQQKRMNEISSRMEEQNVFENLVSDLDKYRQTLNEIKRALGVHEMQDAVFCLEAIEKLKPTSAIDYSQQRGHVALENEELRSQIADLKTSIHSLRCIGAKLAQNVRDSVTLYPDKWNGPAVEQVLQQWREALERS